MTELTWTPFDYDETDAFIRLCFEGVLLADHGYMVAPAVLPENELETWVAEYGSAELGRFQTELEARNAAQEHHLAQSP